MLPFAILTAQLDKRIYKLQMSAAFFAIHVGTKFRSKHRLSRSECAAHFFIHPHQWIPPPTAKSSDKLFCPGN